MPAQAFRKDANSDIILHFKSLGCSDFKVCQLFHQAQEQRQLGSINAIPANDPL